MPEKHSSLTGQVDLAAQGILFCVDNYYNIIIDLMY